MISNKEIAEDTIATIKKNQSPANGKGLISIGSDPAAVRSEVVRKSLVTFVSLRAQL